VASTLVSARSKDSIISIRGGYAGAGPDSLARYSVLNKSAELTRSFRLITYGMSRPGRHLHAGQARPVTPAGGGSVVRRGPIMLLEHPEENVVTCHPVGSDHGAHKPTPDSSPHHL
jgi:hypothetical protein